jgi:hypothetical protein
MTYRVATYRAARSCSQSAGWSRRDFLATGLAALGAAVAAGCSSPVPPTPTPAQQPVAAKPTGPTLVLATAELVVGPNRFAVGIIDEANKPMVDAAVRFSFFQLAEQEGIKRAEAPATFRWVDQRTRGIYTAPVQFDAPGRWGVEAVVEQGGRTQTIRAPFEVKATGSAPMVGSPAVRSKTLTARDVKHASELCTAAPPCELHTDSLDELLGNGQPTVILFASPGFCTSATCAPQLGVLLDVKPRHANRLNFAHVEIFKDPRNNVLADAVTEWNLPSEPWLFFVDRSGVIVERYDGIATAEEIEASIAHLA